MCIRDSIGGLDGGGIAGDDAVVIQGDGEASGLDYPASGPEHAFLHDLGRVTYDVVGDEDTIDAFFALKPDNGIPLTFSLMKHHQDFRLAKQK